MRPGILYGLFLLLVEAIEYYFANDNGMFGEAVSFYALLQLISAQFPNHVDLQRVGEVKFNHEKYNVLRPTLHIVQDYFHDFMLRRDSSEFPTKRVFIDDNGFRHFWSVFRDSESNSRKSDTPINKTNTASVTVNDGTNKHDVQNSTDTRKLPNRKKKVKAQPLDILRAATSNTSPDRTIAKTSFFCPFFGVVTMTTLLD